MATTINKGQLLPPPHTPVKPKLKQTGGVGSYTCPSAKLLLFTSEQALPGWSSIVEETLPGSGQSDSVEMSGKTDNQCWILLSMNPS